MFLKTISLVILSAVFFCGAATAQTGRPLSAADIKERCSDGCAGWCQKRIMKSTAPSLSGCMKKCSQNSCDGRAYR